MMKADYINIGKI